MRRLLSATSVACVSCQRIAQRLVQRLAQRLAQRTSRRAGAALPFAPEHVLRMKVAVHESEAEEGPCL
jgi:hypothetical protein